jgi:hypothetical protein
MIILLVKALWIKRLTREHQMICSIALKRTSIESMILVLPLALLAVYLYYIATVITFLEICMQMIIYYSTHFASCKYSTIII